LRPEESKSIIERLKQCIEKDHILLQPEITLDDVAKKLSVRKHHLSQAINQEFGHSFTELVYNYRLDEAAKRLSDLNSRNQKISAIAYDLGFSSVSVFTTKFRKRFNVTPSVFRETSGGESRQLTPGA
jgi:AraC-like DNA-binding protein